MHISALIDLHLLPEAVELLQEVYGCISDMEYRYEACDVPDVNFCCLEYMDQIVNSADESYKEELYTFCLEKCEGDLSPCTDDLWQKTLFESFTEEKYLKRTLAHIEKCLRQTASEMYPFETVELIRAKVQFMRALGRSEKEIEAFRKQYRRYPAIREDEIREALDQGRIAEATEMLLDFRRAVPPQSPTSRQISERLILLYEEMNDYVSYNEHYPDVLTVTPEECLDFVCKNSDHGGADVVLEVAGADSTFRLAWECARPNAIVTVVALYDKAQTLPLPDMYGKNLTFKTGGVDGCDCEETLKLIAEGKLDTEPLITHTYPLAKIDEAYELFENKRDGVIKVAVEC